MEECFRPCVSDRELNAMSTLALAHVGDAVYELLVRTRLTLEGNRTARVLHREAVRRVSAPAQARAIKKIEMQLTETEWEVFRRGRNAHVHAIPRGAAVGEYHAATGLETLFGWLYLRGEEQRVNELFRMIMEDSDNAT
ncbi:MAG: ribonuclease III domain-containing protein [Eubacteriales bacterium]|nr:ribonuclease III domain-containing protein [Eubacteriales bacterium]